MKIYAQWVSVACNDRNLNSIELIPSQVQKRQGTFLQGTARGMADGGWDVAEEEGEAVGQRPMLNHRVSLRCPSPLEQEQL